MALGADDSSFMFLRIARFLRIMRLLRVLRSYRVMTLANSEVSVTRSGLPRCSPLVWLSASKGVNHACTFDFVTDFHFDGLHSRGVHPYVAYCYHNAAYSPPQLIYYYHNAAYHHFSCYAQPSHIDCRSHSTTLTATIPHSAPSHLAHFRSVTTLAQYPLCRMLALECLP